MSTPRFDPGLFAAALRKRVGVRDTHLGGGRGSSALDIASTTTGPDSAVIRLGGTVIGSGGTVIGSGGAATGSGSSTPGPGSAVIRLGGAATGSGGAATGSASSTPGPGSATLGPGGAPLAFSSGAITPGGAVTRLGSTVIGLGHVDSTQQAARILLARGAPHGAVVVAEEQRAGRGRRGRSWASPPGGGIWATILVRGVRPATDAPWLTLAATLAVCRAARALGVSGAEIKWPNDVVAADRKLAGVLGELVQDSGRSDATDRGMRDADSFGSGPAASSSPHGGSGFSRASAAPCDGTGPARPATPPDAGASPACASSASALLGIGINVDLDPAALSADVDRPVTSLRAEGLPPGIGREQVLAAILACLEEHLDAIAADRSAALVASWRALSPSSSGRRVAVEDEDEDEGTWMGETCGIAADGSLRIRTAAGEVRSVRFGGTLRFLDAPRSPAAAGPDADSDSGLRRSVNCGDAAHPGRGESEPPAAAQPRAIPAGDGSGTRQPAVKQEMFVEDSQGRG